MLWYSGMACVMTYISACSTLYRWILIQLVFASFHLMFVTHRCLKTAEGYVVIPTCHELSGFCCQFPWAASITYPPRRSEIVHSARNANKHLCMRSRCCARRRHPSFLRQLLRLLLLAGCPQRNDAAVLFVGQWRETV